MRTILLILAGVLLVSSAFVVGIALWLVAKKDELSNQLRTLPARLAKSSNHQEAKIADVATSPAVDASTNTSNNESTSDV